MQLSPNKSIIYVDMDDVLVDFVNEAYRTMNVPLSQRTGANLSKFPYKEAITNTKDWWIKVPEKHDAKILIDYVKKFDFRILTAYASWDLRSKTAKYVWMKNHFNIPMNKVLVVQRKEKQQYAIGKDGTPNVLIDDFIKNCNEWNAAGGMSIQHVGARTTIAKLKRLGFDK